MGFLIRHDENLLWLIIPGFQDWTQLTKAALNETEAKIN
jgi:hypothetical protein